MLRCSHCRWGGGRHDKNCPEALKTPDAYERYDRGYDLGRAGKVLHPQCVCPIMKLGHLQGVSAAEAAFNGPSGLDP